MVSNPNQSPNFQIPTDESIVDHLLVAAEQESRQENLDRLSDRNDELLRAGIISFEEHGLNQDIIGRGQFESAQTHTRAVEAINNPDQPKEPGVLRKFGKMLLGHFK